jgi:hypothetical protein
LTQQSWISDIQGTLNVTIEFLDLWDLLSEVELQPEVEDSHTWLFSTNGKYSSKSAYQSSFVRAVRTDHGENLEQLGA